MKKNCILLCLSVERQVLFSLTCHPWSNLKWLTAPWCREPDLSDFCFYCEHGERNKRLQGRRQNLLMNWLASPVIWVKTAPAHSFQEENSPRWTHATQHYYYSPWRGRNSTSSKNCKVLAKLDVKTEVQVHGLGKCESLGMETRTLKVKSMTSIACSTF